MGIPDMNIVGMKAGMGEKSLMGMGMGMAYPPLIRPIAIPTQHLQCYQTSEDDYASNSASGSICLLCFLSALNLPASTCPTLSLPSPTLFFVSPLVQGLFPSTTTSSHDKLLISFPLSALPLMLRSELTSSLGFPIASRPIRWP
ncbi:hypothetical protein Pyn_07295 [Prunus yedoensis var. nudiflora]|uniref:Uncharacterized protein n=1 Tax=Prunus yedoensis var. nudiflora TaxID=2094558 RepID=A0A314XNX3_PRUYE|nr:hypothetical protein Pyn_07295 [Prunus yedoensis var. nudiflora]